MHRWNTTSPSDTQQVLSHLADTASHRLETAAGELIAATQSQMAEGTHSNHPADVSSDLLDAELDLSRIEVLHQEIHEIDDALARLGHGTYGICEECAARIDLARLRVLPSARRCLYCEQRHTVLAERNREFVRWTH
jgi:RNA polymerase-binding transcription factor DksA